METSGRRRGVFRVVFDAEVWRQEVGRYGNRAPAGVAREARWVIEAQGGLRVDQVRRCEAVGVDGTLLAGCVKAYLPLEGRAPSEQPWAFVLRGYADAEGRVELELVSFGLRHPRRGVATAYVRAHTRIHGRPPVGGRRGWRRV